MKIRKMTATFGGLDNATLEPGEGLTVITAPNETGKSTWAGFLKAMLYGIDTRERDKAGFLADKTRYLPWSGAPMSGEIQVEWQGQEITLRRAPTRTNPFGKFEAVYTATGDPVPALTAANAGEQLTGVGREVYLRSAFVGQGGAAIAASGELEARIAALATSGEEDVAYSTVERTLKDWRNRRRLNRSNGLIPQLEEERAGLDAALGEQEETRRRRAEGQRQLERLERERGELQADLELWARVEQHQLNRRYGQAYREWEQARAALPEDKPHPVFGAVTGEEAWAFAQEQQAQRDAAQAENRRREAQRARLGQTSQGHRKTALLWLVLAAVALAAGVGLWLWSGKWPLLLLFGGAALGAIAASAVFSRRGSLARRQREDIADVAVPEIGDILDQAAEYRETLAASQQARAAEAAARRRMEDLAAQGGQLFDTLEALAPPTLSKTELTGRLAAVEGELSRIRDGLARMDGALSRMGDTEGLERRRGELNRWLDQRTEEYDALSIALDALSAANDQLRQRFSPALNREAGAIFAALTGGRWDTLTLARDFSARASAGSAPPRPALALSAGTVEQLYLAVRLAVCRLTVPDAPILLDDALCAFDDDRMALALDALRAEGAGRQILLFSCQGREAAWARAHGVPVISLEPKGN